MEKTVRSKKTGLVRKLLGALIFLLLLGGIYGTYHFYTRYEQLKQNPNQVEQQEMELLKEEVGLLMELPEDEEPTVATVLDKDSLADQPFFAKAENGDKVIAYINARKAILYRPSTKKIIEVAPIYLEADYGNIVSDQQETVDEVEIEEDEPVANNRGR